MNPEQTRRGWLLAAIVVLGVLASAAVAQAQTDEQKKAQARELYERGARLYDLRKYGDAIGAYEQAYLLVEDPALLFNIGQAYRLWDRPDEAVQAYKNYLRKRPDARNRAEVERKIAELEKTIEDRHAKPSGQPTPTAPLAEPPPRPAGNYYTTPPVQEPSPVRQEPGAVPAAAPVAKEPVGVAAQGPAEAPTPKRNWLAYGLLAGGGACLVFSGVMAAVGYSDAQKVRDASKNHQSFDPSVEKNGKAANALAIVGLVVGVATGGVGGYFLWRRSTPTTTAALVPALTPSYAGASAMLTF